MTSALQLDVLSRFAGAVWGNPHVLLGQLRPGVEFIDLGEYFGAFRELFSSILRHDKILVRNEYRTAREAISESVIYQNGVYVIGQPGIGKTYFLVYAIVDLLRHKQPVALQLLNGTPYYVLFKATEVSLHPFVDARPLKECDFVWALCDSNDLNQVPGAPFRFNTNWIRIIQATSPKASRWKGWSKQLGAEPFIMDIWSEEEVLDLANLLKLDVDRVTTLAQKWGSVPQVLLRWFHQEDGDIELRYRGSARKAVQECELMISGGAALDFPQEPPSPFYFLRPGKTATGGISRMLPSVCVPTRTLRCFLAEALQEQSNLVKVQFYRSLSQLADTRQAACFIYKSWFRSFFFARGVVECQWLTRGEDKSMARLPPMLQETTVFIPRTLNAPGSRKPPYYWVPPRGFPGIDGALVLKKEIFVFQVTVRSDHTSPIDGFRTLRDNLPCNVKDLPWRVVFVGPEDELIEQVAKEWAGKLYFPGNKRVAVAWSAVDPAQTGVTYKVYHDESDPVESDEEMMEVEE